MKRILPALAVLLLMNSSAPAQQKQIDSLKRMLKIATSDTSRVSLLVKLSKDYYLRKADSGLIYANTALAIAKKTGNIKGEMRALTGVGYSLWMLGNEAAALQTFIRSQHIAEKLNDKWSIGRNYDGMSCVYYYQGDLKLTMVYALKSEAIFKQIHDYNNVVDELMDIAHLYNDEGKLDSAVEYNNRALGLSIKINEWEWRPQILISLGLANFKLGNQAVAFAYLHRAIALCIKYNQTYNLVPAYYDLATSFERLNKRDSCIFYAKKALMVAQQGSFARNIADATRLLSRMYTGYNDHEAARYYKLNTAINDSLFTAEKAKQVFLIKITEQQHQQEIAEQKQKEREERKENLQLSAIALFIPFFLLSVLFLSRTKIHRRVIEFMSVLSLLLVFEFITLLIHPWIERLTNHTPVYELLISVVLATILVPLHHNLTHWLKEKLVHAHLKHKAVTAVV